MLKFVKTTNVLIPNSKEETKHLPKSQKIVYVLIQLPKKMSTNKCWSKANDSRLKKHIIKLKANTIVVEPDVKKKVDRSFLVLSLIRFVLKFNFWQSSNKYKFSMALIV